MEVGDVVSLLSGGSRMTVESVGPDEKQNTPDGMVRLVWFEKERGCDVLRRAIFPRALLGEPELREAGPLPS